MLVTNFWKPDLVLQTIVQIFEGVSGAFNLRSINLLLFNQQSSQRCFCLHPWLLLHLPVHYRCVYLIQHKEAEKIPH